MDAEKPRKPRAPRKAKIEATDTATETVSTPPADAPPADATPADATPVDTVLHLAASLEIKDVENAHRQFLAMFDRGPSVTVDISHVAAMDTAGVQLLLAFQSEAVRRGVALDFTGQSTAFTHALTAVGLGEAVRHVASRD